jgi:CRP/FNR family transcriptional regulator
LQTRLLQILSQDLASYRGLMLLLGVMNAEQRIAAFLMGLSRRYRSLGYGSNRFRLAMRQEEIGSFLGLTFETVSRVFTQLKREGLLVAGERDDGRRELSLPDVETLKSRIGEW